MSDTIEGGSGRFARNVLLKGLALFVLANLLVALINPGWLGQISLYNRLFPGRARLPFGEDSASYNLSLYNLDAMFASHEIAGRDKAADEYRVVVIGDSSIWGTLLRPEETLAGQINALGLTCSGRRVRAYNLGYPTISLTKDVILLRRALAYDPDRIVWGVTLEALPVDKQLSSPLVENNLPEARDLTSGTSPEGDWNVWERTIIGQRRALADLARLQLYGVMWAATGVDQVYPATYPPAQVDFEADGSFHGRQEGDLPGVTLAWDVLETGMRIANEEGAAVLLVNEPMLISTGKNSDLRYNFFYPRWAYDKYRANLTELSAARGWELLDAWDAVPASEFTNSAIHLTPAGEGMLAGLVARELCVE